MADIIFRGVGGQRARRCQPIVSSVVAVAFHFCHRARVVVRPRFAALRAILVAARSLLLAPPPTPGAQCVAIFPRPTRPAPLLVAPALPSTSYN